MNAGITRDRMTILLAFGLFFAGAACGSSASTVGAPPTTGSPTTSTTGSKVTVTPSSPPTPVPDACSLATTADVTVGLGAAPSVPGGTPTRYEATYVTCDWSATPPGASNANSLRLGVVEKTTPGQKGFSVPSEFPDARPVAGLGDNATIYSRPGVFEGLVLIADKGQFTIALNGQYGGTAPAEPALESALVALARKAFVAVRA